MLRTQYLAHGSGGGGGDGGEDDMANFCLLATHHPMQISEDHSVSREDGSRRGSDTVTELATHELGQNERYWCPGGVEGYGLVGGKDQLVS